MRTKKIFSIMKARDYIYKIGAAFLLVVGMVSTMGCSDDFLAEKRPYGSFGENDIYTDWESVKLRLNYIYQGSLPYFRGYNSSGGTQGGNSTATNGPSDQWPVGFPDFLSTNGDEFVYKYTYDKKGFNVKTECDHYNGSYVYTILNEYDKAGDLVKQTTLDQFGDVDEVVEF